MCKFQFNQEMTLKSDPDFRGFVFGQLPDGSEIVVTIKEPGKLSKQLKGVSP